MKKVIVTAITVLSFSLSLISCMKDHDQEKKIKIKLLFNDLERRNDVFQNSIPEEKKQEFMKESYSTFANSLLKSYGQEIIDKALAQITSTINNKENFSKLESSTLILLFAGANTTYPNVPLLLKNALINKNILLTGHLLKNGVDPDQCEILPLLFYAKTKKYAQLLKEFGADIHIKQPILETNVLWELIENKNPSEEKNLKLFQFYLNEKVDPKLIRPIDNNSLFHHFASKAALSYNNENFLKLGKMLLSAIPAMINTLNKYGKTPLDIMINEKEYYKKGINEQDKELSPKITTISKNYKNGVKFLKNNNAQESLKKIAIFDVVIS